MDLRVKMTSKPHLYSQKVFIHMGYDSDHDSEEHVDVQQLKRDLKLAAEIGQSLLKQNIELEERCSNYHEQLETAERRFEELQSECYEHVRPSLLVSQRRELNNPR
jgi:predicted RNase H-like nuclease (RuvC/YqgF family)